MVLPEAEVEDEDDVPLVRRPRAPVVGAPGGSSSLAGPAAAASPAASAAPMAAATSATAAGTSAASAATGAVATPRGSAVPPKRGIFTGYSLKLNPPRDGAPAGAGKRGITDTAPAAPSKKPCTRASASASQTSTRTSGADTTPAANPVLEEEEPAAAREKADKEYEDVLATTQARLNENSELVSGYSSQLQALRGKLEEQAKAAEDVAAEALARRETELREQFRTRERELVEELNSAKERSTNLESELTTAQGELIKTGEDNVGNAKEIVRLSELLRKANLAVVSSRSNHDKLAEQRRRETEKLLEIAQAFYLVLVLEIDSRGGPSCPRVL
ncbi:PRKC apoptosis WT1 regulator protein-like [Brachypodium distachyon]|uniref:PRKC apoptosis WT1 regulator protein-like n=1 Tax=Brachypodium distachyon TaxID=15368 RepID=UPI00052FE175|nr:PRKC apoptosis WT1 regulator protein-like [Brachypodium distachyon]|eukprot:XP_024314553.1 PRKC apoptosis WT1 regulator protein-like [Brachypodium distachyon]